MPEGTGHRPPGGDSPGPEPGPGIAAPPPRWLLAVDKSVRRVLLLGVRAYQRCLGWLLGGQCRFYPSCSNYAVDALWTKPAPKAVALIAWRILRCNPLCKGGFEEVPEHPRDGVWSLGSKKPPHARDRRMEGL